MVVVYFMKLSYTTMKSISHKDKFRTFIPFVNSIKDSIHSFYEQSFVFFFCLTPKLLRYKSYPSCIHLCGITVNVLYTFCVIDLFEWQLQRKEELLSSFCKELVVFKRIKIIFSNIFCG